MTLLENKKLQKTKLEIIIQLDAINIHNKLQESSCILVGINGRYKIDRERLRIVWEIEKPKNLYV